MPNLQYCRLEAESSYNKRLGRDLALRRACLGRSLADVAAAADISPSHLQAHEAGDKAIPFGRLVRFAQVLEAPLTVLVDHASTAQTSNRDTGLPLQLVKVASRLTKSQQTILLALARELARSIAD